MLEKMAAGLLGNAVSGVLGGLFGDKSKKTDAATGFEDILAGSKEKTEAEKLGINEKDEISAGTSEALSLLREMTSGGIEGYFRFMVKQIREKVMDSMGVTEESLAAMDPAQRDAVTKAIEEEVKKQVAKIMGVDPESAQKMIAEADAVQGVGAAGKVEAEAAYKKGGKSAAEMLSEILNG